jgi:hypothetical protein
MFSFWNGKQLQCALPSPKNYNWFVVLWCLAHYNIIVLCGKHCKVKLVSNGWVLNFPFLFNTHPIVEKTIDKTIGRSGNSKWKP